MKTRHFTVVPVAIAAFLFLAVVHTVAHAGDNKFFSKEETLAHTTNKTEEWSKGAGFYSADGKLLVVWEGEKHEGTWRVKDSGEMCVTLALWGDEGCHQYELKDGSVHLVFDGKGTVRKTEDGNTLESYL